MSRRYFIEQPPPPPDQPDAKVVLGGTEAHHLLHVMRARVGDRVVLFDGSGREFAAVIEQLGRSDIRLRIECCEAVDRELDRDVTLAVALPKGERQRWLVEKATELGAARLIPLECERGVAQPTAKALERLRRAVVEASKQCGRNRLMEVAEPVQFATLLGRHDGTTRRLIAQPRPAATGGGKAAGGTGSASPFAPGPGEVVAAVGPEGGFSPEEVAAAREAGFEPVDLGPRILRVETAAVALLTLLGAGQSGGGVIPTKVGVQ